MDRCRRVLDVWFVLCLIGGVVSLCCAAPAAAAPGAPEGASAQVKGQGSVDVNAASEEELVNVPGIGKSLARRIVEFREKNGPYRQIEDLLKIQGIGEKSLQKLRPYLSVGKVR